ncbi:MAG TPA: 16S rRNA (guanine(527)-N(7))-methyltransferase RsmG [Alcanivoracaceae bacterium]|nr:16S rRNA (guanine(527)-N(7))-methyltransferase RsmG [Alcanivoracaceae bacterium]
MTELADLLRRGAAQLEIALTAEQEEKLLAYVALLHKWNKAYNLTAIREPRDMVVRHLLDSLAVLPWLSEAETLDVGTGAGVPGIVLAVMRTEQNFVLLDSNGKKTRFVRQAALALGLQNVTVVQSRVEAYEQAVPQVIARAFASLPDMLALLGHLVLEEGCLLAMKAAQAEDEIAQAPSGWQFETKALQVPFLNEQRELVIVQTA